MSLISEALRKARQEAARRDARRAALALPGETPRRRGIAWDSGIVLGVVFAAVVVVAAVLGGWWALGSGGEAGGMAPAAAAAAAPTATPTPAPAGTPAAVAPEPSPAATAGAPPDIRSAEATPRPKGAPPTPTPGPGARRAGARPRPTPPPAGPGGSFAVKVGAAEPQPLLDVPAQVSGEARPGGRGRAAPRHGAGQRKPAARKPEPAPTRRPKAAPTPRPPATRKGGAGSGGTKARSATSRQRVFTATARLGSVTLELDYIVYRASDPFAQINGLEVHEGSEIEGFTVVEITPSAVKLKDEMGEIVIKVR